VGEPPTKSSDAADRVFGNPIRCAVSPTTFSKWGFVPEQKHGDPLKRSLPQFAGSCVSLNIVLIICKLFRTSWCSEGKVSCE